MKYCKCKNPHFTDYDGELWCDICKQKKEVKPLKEYRYQIAELDEITICDAPEVAAEFKKLQKHHDAFLSMMSQWKKLKVKWVTQKTIDECELTIRTWVK